MENNNNNNNNENENNNNPNPNTTNNPQPTFPNPLKNLHYSIALYPLLNSELTVATQSLKNPLSTPRKYIGIFSNYQCLYNKLTTEGIGSLYIGFLPFLLGFTENDLSKYILHKFEEIGLKKRYNNTEGQNINNNDSSNVINDRKDLIDFFVYSFLGEALTSVIIHPFDTVMIRLVSDFSSEGVKEYSNLFNCISQIYQKEGVFDGFFSGLRYKLLYKGVKCVFKTLEFKYRIKENFIKPFDKRGFYFYTIRSFFGRFFEGIAVWRMSGYRGGFGEKFGDFADLYFSDTNLHMLALAGGLGWLAHYIENR